MRVGGSGRRNQLAPAISVSGLICAFSNWQNFSSLPRRLSNVFWVLPSFLEIDL